MIGLVFIGISYLLVYIGAVSMLFLFILMLIDIRISELHSENNNSLFLAFSMGTLFYFLISYIIPNNIFDLIFDNVFNIVNNEILTIIYNT
jgi:NADH-ubiquinone oxidoreductase chain 6